MSRLKTNFDKKRRASMCARLSSMSAFCCQDRHFMIQRTSCPSSSSAKAKWLQCVFLVRAESTFYSKPSLWDEFLREVEVRCWMVCYVLRCGHGYLEAVSLWMSLSWGIWKSRLHRLGWICCQPSLRPWLLVVVDYWWPVDTFGKSHR